MRKLSKVFFCHLLLFVQLLCVFSQDQDPLSGGKDRPREQNLLVDIPLTLAEIMAINMGGNIYWRLWGPDSEAAYFTLDSIRYNLKPSTWGFEGGPGGDTFLVNQLFHPFAGGLYFASARSNNFNFYQSTLGSVLGSVVWETFAETDMPATNDTITTVVSGIALGEMMHRLFLELDKGGIGARIGASFLSPTDRITAAVRGYGPEEGPYKIHDASLAFGFSFLNARFFETNDVTISWDTASFFTDFALVYGNPYETRSKTPYDQFDLNLSLMLAVPQLYNLTLISDGYLASWPLADNEADQASNGITFHFDAFVTDKGFMDMNNGRENISFTANSLDYTLKWHRILNSSLELSLKTHIGFSPWAVATYNGGVHNRDCNLYLVGGNIKLFLELGQRKDDGRTKNGQAIALDLCFYDAWQLPKTPNFDNNSLFFSSKIGYSFPLTEKFSIYAADHFMVLHVAPYDSEFLPRITRWYNNAQIGMKISFF